MTRDLDIRLAVSRQKLEMMKNAYARSEQNQSGSAFVRQLEMQSLRRVILKLTEEIIRCEIARAEANNEPYVSSGLIAASQRR